VRPKAPTVGWELVASLKIFFDLTLPFSARKEAEKF
jgi:hypothetical protein